ncbi:MAG: outer membrane beta-barrel protein [Bacteroidia bacterium]
MKRKMDIVKSLSLIMAFLMSGFVALAQTETPENEGDTETIVITSDTTEIILGKRRFVIISDDEGKKMEIKKSDDDVDSESDDDWDPDYEKKESKKNYSDVGFLALDLGHTDYFVDNQYGVDAAGNPALELKAFRPGSHVALHFLPTTVSVVRGVVNLKSAITVDWNNYYFVNDITLREGAETLVIDTTGVNFDKNKLTARYVQVPLLLNLNTDPGGDDGVSISFGVYGGMLWKSWTKQVSSELGKVKVDGDYNLNPIRYGLMARVDFKWFDIYAMYNLSNLFDEGISPQTQTFMAGINVIDF